MDPYNLNSVSGPMSTGATVARFGSAVDQLTNNPNPKFDPSGKPGSVTIKRVPKPRYGATAGSTHGKKFAPNRQTLFGGKTIRRV